MTDFSVGAEKAREEARCQEMREIIKIGREAGKQWADDFKKWSGERDSESKTRCGACEYESCDCGGLQSKPAPYILTLTSCL